MKILTQTWFTPASRQFLERNTLTILRHDPKQAELYQPRSDSRLSTVAAKCDVPYGTDDRFNRELSGNWWKGDCSEFGFWYPDWKEEKKDRRTEVANLNCSVSGLRHQPVHSQIPSISLVAPRTCIGETWLEAPECINTGAQGCLLSLNGYYWWPYAMVSKRH